MHVSCIYYNYADMKKEISDLTTLGHLLGECSSHWVSNNISHL